VAWDFFQKFYTVLNDTEIVFETMSYSVRGHVVATGVPFKFPQVRLLREKAIHMSERDRLTSSKAT
jgi:hypothetical protein